MRTRIALAAALAVVITIAGSTAGILVSAGPAASAVQQPQPTGPALAGLTRSGPAPARSRAADTHDPGAFQAGPLVLGAAVDTQVVGATDALPHVAARDVVAPPPAPPAPPPAPVTDATSVWTPDWACIRVHESGGRYNSPAAPSGAYGIVQVTWNSFGLSGWPYQASAALQNSVALELYHRYGWAPWSTRFACGL